MNPTRKKEPSQLKVSVTTRKSDDQESHSKTLVEESAGAESLETVRDILFGAQSREYENRFARLEERLIKEAEDLRNDLKNHFHSLEVYVKQEVASLTGRMTDEHKEKSDSLNELNQELSNLGKHIQQRIDQLDSQATQGQQELRQQVLDQQQVLSQEIQQKNVDLSAKLDIAIEELRTEKLDRVALAEMFMESALRLKNAFKLPEKDSTKS